MDESGTNVLDSSKASGSNLYICVAVVVDEAGRKATEYGIEDLSKRLNGGSEIASKAIGPNHDRRMRFLKEINSFPFHYYALAVNKDHLPKSGGFQFKRSFYKYFNQMLYRKLSTGSNRLHIVADEYGGRDFMDSFQAYLENKGLPDLFSSFSHDFVSSAESRMIQIADLIAGTLMYCFDQDKKGEHSAVFRRILRDKEIDIKCWPPSRIARSGIEPITTPSLDSLLYDVLCQRAQDFIDKYEESYDEDQQMQVVTLKHLLFARLYEEGTARSIYANSLIEKLKEEGFEELSDQTFKLRVVGKLRDGGVIITGSNDGYRLALEMEDITDYLHHDRSIIEPMLQRLLMARETVKKITNGQCDILSVGGFENLLRIADEFKDSCIELQAQRSVQEMVRD